MDALDAFIPVTSPPARGRFLATLQWGAATAHSEAAACVRWQGQSTVIIAVCVNRSTLVGGCAETVDIILLFNGGEHAVCHS